MGDQLVVHRRIALGECINGAPVEVECCKDRVPMQRNAAWISLSLYCSVLSFDFNAILLITHLGSYLEQNPGDRRYCNSLDGGPSTILPHVDVNEIDRGEKDSPNGNCGLFRGQRFEYLF
jgi:hypothetical protein